MKIASIAILLYSILALSFLVSPFLFPSLMMSPWILHLAGFVLLPITILISTTSLAGPLTGVVLVLLLIMNLFFLYTAIYKKNAWSYALAGTALLLLYYIFKFFL